jgi:uncharacterized protein with HEPN domain
LKDDRVYLVHIQQCIEKIETYTKDGARAFREEPMIQDAVMRNLEIIGEAAKNLSAAFRREHPEVGWRRAMALRNMLIHNYMGVNVRRVWSDVTQTIPTLKAQIDALLGAPPATETE